MPEGGQVDVIDLGSPKGPTAPASGQPQPPLDTSLYSPEQRRTLAEAEHLESLAQLNRAREEETRASAELIRTRTRYYIARIEQLPKELELEEKRVQAALMSASAALKNADTNARQLGLDALVESFNAVNNRLIRYQRELENLDAFIRELERQVPYIETRQVGPNGEVIITRQPDWSRAPREVSEALKHALRLRQQLQNNIRKLQNEAARLQKEIEKFR